MGTGARVAVWQNFARLASGADIIDRLPSKMVGLIRLAEGA